MSAKDIRAAAERWENSGRGECMFPEEAIEIASVLADAYLAKHRPDDAEPVTEQWLLSVGFHGDSLNRWSGLNIRHEASNIIFFRDPEDGSVVWQVLSQRYVGDQWKTRGDVRRLCSALGIELEERK